ncbi:hypothetical protein MP638_003223 [Amoeboaphelidium occidentale]|nr:hypothetical protein MP638_003223 [Amoeboaphelidium occidentale]
MKQNRAKSECSKSESEDDAFISPPKKKLVSEGTQRQNLASGAGEKLVARLPGEPDMMVVFYGKFGQRTQKELRDEATDLNLKCTNDHSKKGVTHIVANTLTESLKHFAEGRNITIWNLKEWEDFLKNKKKEVQSPAANKASPEDLDEELHKIPQDLLKTGPVKEGSSAVGNQNRVKCRDKVVQLVCSKFYNGKDHDGTFWFGIEEPDNKFVIKGLAPMGSLQWPFEFKHICCAKFDEVGFEFLHEGQMISGEWTDKSKKKWYFLRNITFFREFVPEPPSFHAETFFYYSNAKAFEENVMWPKLKILQSVVERCGGGITTRLGLAEQLNVKRGIIFGKVRQKHEYSLVGVEWMTWDEFLQRFNLTALFD